MYNNGVANEDVDLIANADPVIFEKLTVNHPSVDISGETIIFFRANTGDTLSKRAIYGFDARWAKLQICNWITRTY